MSKVVDRTQEYYNSSDADEFYFRVWGGKDIHVGLYESDTEPISDASHRTVQHLANKLSHLIKQNLPAAMQGLVVVPLFAGYDLRRRLGRVWKYEVTGGRYEEKEFESVGSGSVYARESLKKSWKPDASREEALRMAVQALTDAADEDRGTGGVHEAADDEIAQVHQQIQDARRRGAA